MASNREIVRQFRLYAELLLLHNKDERLSALLSGAAYRIGKMTGKVVQFDQAELQKLFRPEIIKLIQKLKTSKTIDELDELIQLTPTGLFEMMRIRGLGGKKLSILWQKAKIDTIDALLEACKNNMLTKIPGFGAKTQQNIIDSIEAYRSEREQFHYASVADTATELVLFLQKSFKTKLISL